MRWIGILNDEGEIVEEGTCPDNCDYTTAIGRPPKVGDRYLDGKGFDVDAAKADAEFYPPTEI